MSQQPNSSPPPPPVVIALERMSRRPGPACPACQTAREAGAKYCPTCGNQLDQPPAAGPSHLVAAEPPPPSPTAAPPALPDAVAEQPQGGGTHGSSPAPAHAQEPVVTTCGCGQPLPPESQYCSHCGTKVPPAAAGSGYSLSCRTPAGKSFSLPLSGQEWTVGKAPDCTVAIADDGYLSRWHARLALKDGRVFLEDLGSANGTFLRIRGAVPLEVGDEILVGTCLLRLEKQGA